MATKPETTTNGRKPRPLKLTRVTLKDLDARKDVKGGQDPNAISNKYRCGSSTC